MTNRNAFLATLVAVLVLGGLVVYRTRNVQEAQVQQASFGTSDAGSTFNSARFAGVAIALSSATSTSVTNGDANDRFITAVKLGCSGLGVSKAPITGAALTNLTVTAATSSAALAVPPGSVFAAIALNSAIGTTTQWYVSASTTIPGGTNPLATSSLANVWPAGTVVNFWFNATNTGACTIGVDYIPS